MGESWQRAFLSSLVLAQIGEFSFVLGAAALDHAIIGTEIHRLIVAVPVISLVTSPLWMDGARRLRHRSAGRIDSLGWMFRLIYFREVRPARRTGRSEERREGTEGVSTCCSRWYSYNKNKNKLLLYIN